MEPAAAIALVRGSLALGAPTCLGEASDAGPVWTKAGIYADFNMPFC